jgi:hypothetical protein
LAAGAVVAGAAGAVVGLAAPPAPHALMTISASMDAPTLNQRNDRIWVLSFRGTKKPRSGKCAAVQTSAETWISTAAQPLNQMERANCKRCSSR